MGTFFCRPSNQYKLLVRAKWLKWCQIFGFLYNPRVPLKLKDKFYSVVIRHIILYEVEYWPTKSRYVQQLSVAEMCMLRYIYCHRRRNRARNDDIYERLVMTLVEEKLMQYRLKWFRYIQLRSVKSPIHNEVIRRIDNKKRNRGRPNLI
jgi:hypothetical protein